MNPVYGSFIAGRNISLQNVLNGCRITSLVVNYSGLRSRVSKHPLLTGTVVVAGAGLAYVAARGLMNNNGAAVARDVHIEKSISIEKLPAELYTFWRDFTNLPLFMTNLYQDCNEAQLELMLSLQLMSPG